jgi:hypothetical protein
MPYFCAGGGGSTHVHANKSVLDALMDAGNGRVGSFDSPPGTDDWEGVTPPNIHDAVARLAAAFRKHVGTKVPALD